ncbi:hypothetical protein DMH04_30050 [Kibdelosporangium aridum]|uniref:Uncharacterized protein n=1 Tax=Kibdelosporangium aridum TaxID=2030 RepID=A0A428Z382_KIBAR|nr:hypothetical protein [Kibdelosporangium aridum]RSM80378.1 hypothetical protein DMH04_30050 [Kibdelosporangium aridum]
MTTSTKEIDYPGEDEAAGATPAATATAPAEPKTEPAPQTDEPDCPTHTHLHPDGTTHPGIQCSGGCPR